jgi:hypothetical protein
VRLIHGLHEHFDREDRVFRRSQRTRVGVRVKRAFTITITYTQGLSFLQEQSASFPAPLGTTGIK